MKIPKLTSLALLILLSYGCQEHETLKRVHAKKHKPHVSSDNMHSLANARTPNNSLYEEDFTRANTNYILNGTVLLGSNEWWFDDARIYDNKLRIRNVGQAMMYFYYPHGAGTVTIKHSKTTAAVSNSTWRMFVMYEDNSWNYVGQEFLTSSSTFSTASVEVNASGNIIIGVEKLTGSGDLYFDDLTINAFSSCGGVSTPGIADQGNNLLMGNPSDANTSSNNYLLNRTEYSLSFNSSKGIPNWVSWHLSSGWSTNMTRSGSWGQDELLPGTLHQASDSDYTGSGFDRGHLCPVDDRDFSLTYMDNTFKFSNAFPQNPRINQHGPWRKFEDYLKTLSVSSDKEIYIIAGTFGLGGQTNAGVARTSLPNDVNVKVPSHCWKVALILPNGTDDVCRTDNAQMIAIYVPNVYSDGNWQEFSVTVDQVELTTGYNFFEEIADDVESLLEATSL